jgi:hypothetical protein
MALTVLVIKLYASCVQVVNMMRAGAQRVGALVEGT